MYDMMACMYVYNRLIVCMCVCVYISVYVCVRLSSVRAKACADILS